MMKWVTEYIKINQQKWDIERERKEAEVRKEIEAWEKMKRKDKIKLLQKKWRKENDEQDKMPKIEPIFQSPIQWQYWKGTHQ